MIKKGIFVGVFLIFLTALLILGLNNDPRELENKAVGKSLNLNLPDFFTGNMITNNDLPKNQAFLLNVWSNDCQACYLEHPYLLELSKTNKILGIFWDWSDSDSEKGKLTSLEFLNKMGNPYFLVVNDKKGELIIDLGVYGAPETFLIGKDFKILQRHTGILNQKVFNEKFKNLMEDAK